ncbi:hypothetical protein D9M71_116620 [compost metagenome]
MGTELLRIQINDKYIEIVADEISIQGIDTLDGFLCVGSDRRAGTPKKVDCRGLTGTRHVVTRSEYLLADALIEHPLALRLAIVPVQPAILGTTHFPILRNR